MVMGGVEEVTEECGIPVDCARTVPSWLVTLDNVPTVVMFVLGAALLWLIWWPLAVAFLIYCGLSIVMFWGLICPHCHHFDTKACPCGYGAVAPKLFKRREGSDFRAVFRQRIGIMFPAWIVPFVAGVYQLWNDPSLYVFGLFLAFCIVGFALIPAISKYVGCRGCEIKDQCPWMT